MADDWLITGLLISYQNLQEGRGIMLRALSCKQSCRDRSCKHRKRSRHISWLHFLILALIAITLQYLNFRFVSLVNQCVGQYYLGDRSLNAIALIQPRYHQERWLWLETTGTWVHEHCDESLFLHSPPQHSELVYLQDSSNQLLRRCSYCAFSCRGVFCGYFRILHSLYSSSKLP